MARHRFVSLMFRVLLISGLALATTAAPGVGAASPPAKADLAASTIAFGETVGGAIDNAGESDAYTFAAQAGDRVLAAVTTESGSLWPRIRLYAPGSGGTPFLTSENATRAEVSGRLPVTGNYTILVDDGFNGALTGVYNAYLQRLNAPGGATPIGLGETLEGAIDPVGEIEAYTVQAYPDDTLLVAATTFSGSLWPRIRVYSPTGRLLGTAGGTTHTEITPTLGLEHEVFVPMVRAPGVTARGGEAIASLNGATTHTEPGTYTILIDDDFTGALAGSFSLHVQRLSEPGNVITAPFGQTLEGSIDPVGEFAAYTFSALEGDTILVAATTSSGSLWPHIRLYGHDGALLGESSASTHAELTKTLPFGSEYTVLINDGFNGALAGTYGLQVQRLNRPGMPTAVSFGHIISDTAVAPIGDLDAFTFAASEGDTILMAATTSSGSLWPRIRLYDPQGALVGESSASTHTELTKTLSLAGEHTVLVDDGFNGALTGSYGLWAQRLNDPGNAIPLSGGVPITGTIATIGETDTFVISGDAGDTFLVSASNKSGSLWPRLRLYTPSGDLLVAGSASTHVEITPTLSSGGNHTLLVGDGFNGALIGTYTVQPQPLP